MEKTDQISPCSSFPNFFPPMSDSLIIDIKNAAFVQSEFTEFVYMDSDNIPLVDPAVHFDSVEYRNSGSVFWPDLYKDHRKSFG